MSTITATTYTDSSMSSMGSFIPPKSPYAKVSSDDIDFQVACTVQDSWDVVTRKSSWSKEAGPIFLHKLFELCPPLQHIWGLEEADRSSSKFVRKGSKLILEVDQAVAYIGPDLALLETELVDMGRRHIRLVSEPEYWPHVGEALLHTLKVSLGDRFTEEQADAWKIIFKFMAYWMIEGLIAEKKDRWETRHELNQAILEDDSHSELPDLLDISATSGGRRRNSGASIGCSRRSSIGCSRSSIGCSRRSSCGSQNCCISMSMSMSRSRRNSNHECSVSYADWDLEANLYDMVDANDIDFTTVELVLDSWQRLLEKPTWQKDCASLILKRLFELVPELKTAWGFPSDFDPNNLDDPSHNRFLHKGLGFMAGVDKAMNFIGTPDLEPLQRELKDLGRIHYLHMAAQPQFWPPVGEALFETLEQVLEPEYWTDETQEAWGLIYHFMAYWMIEGLLAEKRGD